MHCSSSFLPPFALVSVCCVLGRLLSSSSGLFTSNVIFSFLSVFKPFADSVGEADRVHFLELDAVCGCGSSEN